MWRSLVDRLVYGALGLGHGSALGSALDFFVFDAAKILALLVVVVFAISFARSFFPPERTKRALEKVPGLLGDVLAALIGVSSFWDSLSVGTTNVPIAIGLILI